MLTADNVAIDKAEAPKRAVAVPPSRKAVPVTTKKVTANAIAAALITLDIWYSPYC